jgi:hypothetical protein
MDTTTASPPNGRSIETDIPADTAAMLAGSRHTFLELPPAPRAIHCKESWFSNMFVTLPLFPFFGTLLAPLAYKHCWRLGDRSPLPWPIGCGTYTLTVLTFSLFIWCIVSAFVCHFAGITRSDTANPRAYTAVCAELNAIFEHIRDSIPQLLSRKDRRQASLTAITDDERRRVGAYNIASVQYLQACAMLAQGGPQWLHGFGYVNVATMLHRAEEALFEFEDEIAVLGDALYDYQRIDTSPIDRDTRTLLLERIQRATYAISPGMYQLYWSGGKDPEHGLNEESSMARATLRVVRRTMNELRDTIRAELMRVGAASTAASTFLGVAVFALVIACILSHSSGSFGPDPDETRIFVGPLILFLIAAATGLVYRLYSDTKPGRAKSVKRSEDSDLTDLPFEFAPLVSGIAGLGGTLVTGGLANLTSGPILASGISPLFKPELLGQSVIIAALFGVAPGLLFDRLARYTDSLKQDLQATSAAPQTATPDEAG